MFVGHGASDLEARGRRRTRGAMRVLLPDGEKVCTHGVKHASRDAILDILKKYKTIAVVGLSANPMRPSFGVTEYMQSAGYTIIPVNPNETEVLGEKSYARLEDVPEKIEIVNVFRRAEERAPVGERAIRIGGKGVWMQSGIENESEGGHGRGGGVGVGDDD